MPVTVEFIPPLSILDNALINLTVGEGKDSEKIKSYAGFAQAFCGICPLNKASNKYNKVGECGIPDKIGQILEKFKRESKLIYGSQAPIIRSRREYSPQKMFDTFAACR